MRGWPQDGTCRRLWWPRWPPTLPTASLWRPSPLEAGAGTMWTLWPLLRVTHVLPQVCPHFRTPHVEEVGLAAVECSSVQQEKERQIVVPESESGRVPVQHSCLYRIPACTVCTVFLPVPHSCPIPPA